MILLDYPGHLVALFLLIASAVLLAAAYRCRSTENLRVWRWVLGVLQFVAVSIVFVILWNPSRPATIDTTVRNNVLVFFDTSRSMSVADTAGQPRLDRAVELFSKHFSPGHPDSPEYRIHGFDAACYNCTSASALRKWGDQTNFHKVLSLLEKYDVPPSAEASPLPTELSATGNTVGAIIFTDGQADDKDILTYSTLKGQSLRLIVVGLGNTRIPEDIAVTAVKAPARALIDTAYPVEVQVQSRGPIDRPITLELYRDDIFLGAQEIPPRQAHQPVSLTFQVPADRLGHHCITAKASSDKSEMNQANNIRRAMVDVIDAGKTKVLFYSQVASFDIGKIRQSLERDKKTQLSFGLDAIIPPTLSRSSRAMSGHIKLPTQKSEFYEYDVIILGPCEFNRFSKEQLEGLYSFVADRGGGVVFLPGRGIFDLALCEKEQIRTLLPVEFSRSGTLLSREGSLHLTLEGLQSDVLSNDDLKSFPADAVPYHGGLVKKPATSILADCDQDLIACVHRVGRGRVALVNMYGLFRWYREDLQGGLLQRFISGLTSFVGRVSRDEAGVQLFARRSTTEPQKVLFEAHVCDRTFLPVAGATALLTLDNRGPIRMDQTDKGRYVAQVNDLTGEAILAKVEASLNRAFLGERTLTINLPLPRSEMDQVELDETFLKSLAEKSNATYVGGDHVDGTLAKSFPAKSKVSKFSHMTSIWPRWSLLLSLCILLTTTWFIRRRVGLV